MIRIIDGIRYDTRTASLVASDHNPADIIVGRKIHLYQTRSGRFFLHFVPVAPGKREHLEPITPEEAREIYGSLPDRVMSYKEAFGELLKDE
jgi:hypothetical protein